MATLAIVIIVGAIATVVDIRTRRIPNELTASTFLVALAMAATGASGLSVGAAIAGSLLGLALMAPGHVFGAMGAGDVKLLAALGALLGPGLTVAAFIYAAIAGGVLALLVAARRGRLATTVQGTARLVSAPAAAQRDIEQSGANNAFPYGPAI